MGRERGDQGIHSCTKSREEWIFSWAFSLGFYHEDMVIADSKHSNCPIARGNLPPEIDSHQPSCLGPVTLLQQHTGTKHPTRECCGRQAGTWTAGSAPSPAKSTQRDEPEEEELGNLEERGGRGEQAKPACAFSWQVLLGAEAAWPVVWQEPHVLSHHHLPLLLWAPFVLPCPANGGTMRFVDLICEHTFPYCF